MKEDVILERKVSFFESFYILIITVVLMLFMLLFGNVKTIVYLALFLTNLFIVFVNRYNYVKITMYENHILFYFYLLNKSIKVEYKNIYKLSSYSNIYEGLIFKIEFRYLKKKYKLRTKFYDKIFIDKLKKKKQV
ncbi:hypothetical protein H9X57_18265 [Flavobacterium piscinae]|uniref:hypothetical protein n=1 Tax=Flavobacterium piscinae TaxID=2506424 RepID=UPI0019A3E968|nr:hypothetical protein [Flavobacterium piscinae]MBC8884620.1 hypothetical protein [Flavobacterium piscinae]